MRLLLLSVLLLVLPGCITRSLDDLRRGASDPDEVAEAGIARRPPDAAAAVEDGRSDAGSASETAKAPSGDDAGQRGPRLPDNLDAGQAIGLADAGPSRTEIVTSDPEPEQPDAQAELDGPREFDGGRSKFPPQADAACAGGSDSGACGGCGPTLNDVNHCGGCDIQCVPPPNGYARCVGGSCRDFVIRRDQADEGSPHGSTDAGVSFGYSQMCDDGEVLIGIDTMVRESLFTHRMRPICGKLQLVLEANQPVVKITHGESRTDYIGGRADWLNDHSYQTRCPTDGYVRMIGTEIWQRAAYPTIRDITVGCSMLAVDESREAIIYGGEPPLDQSNLPENPAIEARYMTSKRPHICDDEVAIGFTGTSDDNEIVSLAAPCTTLRLDNKPGTSRRRGAVE